MQEEGIIAVQWISGLDNETGIQMKNVVGSTFKKHFEVYCGIYEY